MTNIPGSVQQYDPEDIKNNKTIAMLAYLIFFLPLVACPKSAFGRFHANQGLLIWLICIASAIINFIPFIGGILRVILNIAAIVFVVIGMVNTNKGLAQPLPVIGNISIIK